MQDRPDTHRPGRVFSLVLALIALLAVACGDDGGESGGESSAPLGTEAFGLTEEEFAASIEATEAAIAACMSEAGFEYVPVDVDTIASVEDWLRKDPNMSDREYKTQFGYAASTRFDDPALEVTKGEQNVRIFEDLNEADQVAYERTLWGDDSSATFAIGLDDEDLSATGGCTRTAVEEVFTPGQVTGEFVNPKDDQLDADPRMIEAREQWSACMLEEGFTYDDQDDIIDELEERVEVLLEDEDPEILSAEKQSALEELQSEEIALAVADFDCEVEFINDIEEEVEEEIFGFPVSD